MGGLAAIVVGSLAAIFGLSNSLGYLLPAIIGLESLGIPSPGETALVAAAVLASQGKLEIGLVILIGVTSAIVGDNIGYLLGRRFGRSVFTAPGPFMNHRVRAIRACDQFFDRHRNTIDWVRPTASAIGFPRLTGITDTDDFCAQLASSGVLLLPGSVYDQPGHVRVGFGRKNMPEALQVLDEQLDPVAAS